MREKILSTAMIKIKNKKPTQEKPQVKKKQKKIAIMQHLTYVATII